MIFRNINSNDIKGLIISKEPPISSSEIKVNEIRIDGRNGTIIEKNGYKSRTKSVEIGLNRSANVDEVLSYFSGEGDLIFNCENDKIYKAAIYKAIDLERLIAFRKATVEFYCQPFKYKRNDKYITIIDNITNEGNVFSEPIIRLEKNNDAAIEITVNNVRFKYNFKEEDTYVEIDCEEMTALYEGLNRNRNLEIGYEFPTIQPKQNPIIIHSGDAVVKIKRKDRWL